MSWALHFCNRAPGRFTLHKPLHYNTFIEVRPVTRNMVSEHQRNVQRTLEGNERVWFHPHEDLLAVWHGGPQITIVSSRTFEELEVMNVKTVDRSLSEIEDAVSAKLASRGFDRTGRSRDSTSVTSRHKSDESDNLLSHRSYY
jgi:hypothetical protein